MHHPNDESESIRQLLLVKRDQRWVFRYRSGEEQDLMLHLARTAQDPQQDFDWFDAAVLSHRLGTRLAEQMKQWMGANCTSGR